MTRYPEWGHAQEEGSGVGDSTVTFTSASGDSVDVALKAGQTMWRDAEEQSAKNPGSTDIVALLFELK